MIYARAENEDTKKDLWNMNSQVSTSHNILA